MDQSERFGGDGSVGARGRRRCGTGRHAAQDRARHRHLQRELELRRAVLHLSGANGANGVAGPQLQCPAGTASQRPAAGLPPALIVAGAPAGPWPCGWSGLAGGTQDRSFPWLPMKPYALASIEPPNTLTGDLWHVFWHEQLQIDNGDARALQRTRWTSSPSIRAIRAHDVATTTRPTCPKGRSRSTTRWPTIRSQRVRGFVPEPLLADLRADAAVAPALPTSTSTFVSCWDPATKTLTTRASRRCRCRKRRRPARGRAILRSTRP